VFAQVRLLRRILACGVDRQGRAGPDLTVRMGIRGPHHLAPVFEDLDPLEALAQLGGLVGPEVDDAPDRRRLHPRQRQVMTA
jgi:hypothetical protein